LNQRSLNIVVLGAGKTGSVVADVALERGHLVEMIDVDVNQDGAWLTTEHLRDTNVVIDFTTPQAVLANIHRCLHGAKAMVVGTTGWYGEINNVRRSVEQAGTGFVFGANFSYGVNLFFQIIRAAAPALSHGYTGAIDEIHHVHKKDAPSGTAMTMQRILEDCTGKRVEITSEREGEVPGIHILELESAGDRIVLTHDVKSRRAFAEGAVLAAEWVVDKTGFYDFRDIFSQI
jgi:4-hydroxy-tetrahydrodipicolinate reductase